MGVVYLLRVKVPSSAAKRTHGYGWIWKVVARVRMRPPETTEGLFDLFYPHVKEYLPTRVGIIRNNAKGESRGFKSVVYGQMNHRTFEIIRRGRAWADGRSQSQHKPVPLVGDKSLPLSRQPAWFRSEEDEHRVVRRPGLGRFGDRVKQAEARSI